MYVGKKRPVAFEEAGMVISWDCAPLSLHPMKTYRHWVPQLTGETAAIECVDPCIQLKVSGVVTPTPSTVTKPEPVTYNEPNGDEATVKSKTGALVSVNVMEDKEPVKRVLQETRFRLLVSPVYARGLTQVVRIELAL